MLWSQTPIMDLFQSEAVAASGNPSWWWKLSVLGCKITYALGVNQTVRDMNLPSILSLDLFRDPIEYIEKLPLLIM